MTTGNSDSTSPATDGAVRSAPKTTVSAQAAPAPVEAPEASLVKVLKKKEMIAQVAELSGVKRAEAKKAMEATLKLLGDALQEGSEVNLPPLGKLSVNRQKETAGAHVIIAKLRRSKTMLGDAQGEVTPDEGNTEEG